MDPFYKTHVDKNTGLLFDISDVIGKVWMDEYKELFYSRINHNLGNYGDVSSRKALRQGLKCRLTYYQKVASILIFFKINQPHLDFCVLHDLAWVTFKPPPLTLLGVKNLCEGKRLIFRLEVMYLLQMG